jgi:hypothetical protein
MRISIARTYSNLGCGELLARRVKSRNEELNPSVEENPIASLMTSLSSSSFLTAFLHASFDFLLKVTVVTFVALSKSFNKALTTGSHPGSLSSK